MLRKAHGLAQILYLEMLQQCLQLGDLLFWNIFYDLCKCIEALQLDERVCKLSRIGDDAVIVVEHGLIPPCYAKLLFCRQQFRIGRRQLQGHSAILAEVGVKAEGEPEEVFRSPRQSLGAGRCFPELLALYDVSHGSPQTHLIKDAVFSVPHLLPDLCEVQQFKDTVRQLCQLRQKIVFRVKPSKLLIRDDIRDHMTALLAGGQITEVLKGKGSGVFLHFVFDLYLQKPAESQLLIFVQRSQRLSQRVPFQKAVVLICDLQSRMIKFVKLIYLQIELLAGAETHPVQCVLQLPRGSGKVQRGTGFVVGHVIFGEIEL